MTRSITLVLCVIGLSVGLSGQARKEVVDGIRNFTQVDAVVACAGATATSAMPTLQARGFKAVVNLRLATETGAAIDESRAAAEAAGLRFIHLPLNGSAPDEAVADAFIKAVTDPANQPVLIYCGSANRVGALWLAKRLLVDKWDEARAIEEARLIGLSSDALQQFALAYAAKRQ
jgi:uncharacterized protein (TIGR01244 family)